MLVLEIRTVADCAQAWLQLGEALGTPELARPRAEALRASLKPSRKKGPRTLTLVWKAPWI